MRDDAASYNRRLAAILAADIAGYSRLMGEDEPATVRALKGHQAAILPLVGQHGGRVIDTAGDGILAEFASVIGATECAVAIQSAMARRNQDVPEHRQMWFRIGINLGDVIHDETRIYGDGINVAARLEGLAEAGGVLVSQAVHDQVRDRLHLEFDDLGERELKNIARPVRVYRMAPSSHAPRAPAAVATSEPPLALPDKPSVAVLPFVNMSSDPEQEFLADGVAEDVITALSHYPSLFVIARNSSFTYKGRAVEIRRVGRELGVRYVLEGGLRKAGHRIRVTAQLIEAETGNHVWAERYDRDLADIFAVQDEITEAVTIAIIPAISQAEQQRAMRKPPDKLDAWAAYQRGLWHLGKFSAADNSLAQTFFQQAIDLDPGFAAGYCGFASALISSATQFQTVSLSDCLRVGEPAIRRALALDPGDAESRAVLGTYFMLRGDLDASLAEAERALSVTPNLAEAHSVKGVMLGLTGRPEEGAASLRAGVRLDPRNPRAPLRQSQLALVLYLSGDYSGAAEGAQRITRSHPDHPSSYRYLAAALGQLGRREHARAALDKAIALSPAAFDMYHRSRPPWFRPEDHAHLLDGLRKAGWQG
jgi:adenylate cyclase